MYLIDTIEGRPPFELRGGREAAQLLGAIANEEVAISVINYAGPYEGTLRRISGVASCQQLQELATVLDVLPADREVARIFAEQSAHLRQRGLLIPGLHLLLAATTFRHDLTLISCDRHLARIPALKRH